MLKDLVRLANHLDSKGLVKEADVLDKIIKLAGRRVVEKIGNVKIYKDSDWGEYIVVPEGSTPTCDSAYHTDDMEDAIDTARAMDKKQLNKEADFLDGVITKLSGDYPDYPEAEVAETNNFRIPSDYEIKGMLQLYDKRQADLNNVFKMLNQRGIARDPDAIALYLDAVGISKGSDAYNQIMEKAKWNNESSN